MRAEAVSKAVRSRLEDELAKAIDRKPASEVRLAGALRAVAPLSPQLRASLAESVSVMTRRRSSTRELFTAGIRSIAEAGDAQSTSLVLEALALPDSGGCAALTASALSTDAKLAPALAKLSVARQAQVSFAAEAARVVRGEANGRLLESVAPMIKESHRVALTCELFLPLARAGTASRGAIGPALSVLRSAERHVGRWLVLASVAVRSGDGSPLAEAATLATTGPESSRPAWKLVSWALGASLASSSAAGVPVPDVRPTVELAARLSDRASSDKDLSFVFRLASAGSSLAKPLIEQLSKQLASGDADAIRASLILARDHGRDDLRATLGALARGEMRDEHRGIAAAALFDAGSHDEARVIAEELAESKHVSNVAWAALVLNAAQRSTERDNVLSERNHRWIQQGWLE